MLGKTHLSVGLGVFGSVVLSDLMLTETPRLFDASVVNHPWRLTWQILLLTGAVAIGSLLPDIDSKNSMLGRYVSLVEDMFGHRRFIHTIWFVFLLTFGLYFYNQGLSLTSWFFLWAVSFHLFLDWLSRGGLDWIYPFGEGYKTYASGASIYKGYRPKLYRVGGTGESVIFRLSLCLNAFLVVMFIYYLFI